jgi:deoxyguanosine kinase
MTAPALTVTVPERHPPYRYLAIEGPIGVGKTSLAERLAERWSTRTLLERPADNPFLERFYGDMERYALPTQLHFALQTVSRLLPILSRKKTISLRVSHCPTMNGGSTARSPRM